MYTQFSKMPFRTIRDIAIAGHTYAVMIDATGKIVQTECKGRWAMSPSSTGSDWLDSQLQKYVENNS